MKKLVSGFVNRFRPAPYENGGSPMRKIANPRRSESRLELCVGARMTVPTRAKD